MTYKLTITAMIHWVFYDVVANTMALLGGDKSLAFCSTHILEMTFFLTED